MFCGRKGKFPWPRVSIVMGCASDKYTRATASTLDTRYMTVNRRTIVKSMIAGLVAAGVPASTQESVHFLQRDHRFRIWDAHSHLGSLPGNTPEEHIEVLIRHMDKLGIERLLVSLAFEESERPPSPEQVRVENDRVMRAVRNFPDGG